MGTSWRHVAVALVVAGFVLWAAGGLVAAAWCEGLSVFVLAFFVTEP